MLLAKVAVISRNGGGTLKQLPERLLREKNTEIILSDLRGEGRFLVTLSNAAGH